jgi:nucleoside 2-deoxyribosyltransferase
LLKATVSGSFRKHMPEVYRVVSRLESEGVQVLSPADCRIVDEHDGFVFLASDPWRTIKLVEDRHLRAICASDFLFIVCPEGYVGNSTAFEIGAANARGVPVYAEFPPSDPKMSCLVHLVPSIRELVSAMSHKATEQAPSEVDHVLLDPKGVLERSMQTIERVVKARNERDRKVAVLAARQTFATAFAGIEQPTDEIHAGTEEAIQTLDDVCQARTP